MSNTFRSRLAGILAFAFIVPSFLHAQTAPAEGLRKNTPTVHAFIHARIVRAPGSVIDDGTLIIRNGIITAVGNVKVPDDARIWDMKGLTLYPGLIESYSDYGMPKAPAPGSPREERAQAQSVAIHGTPYWTDAVMSQQNAAELFVPDAKEASQLRSQGFTTALVVPTKGNFRGTSALVSLGEGRPNDLILRDRVAQHITLDVDYSRENYPSSLIGVIAMIRQVLLDAQWYREAHEAYAHDPKLSRPEENESLAALDGTVRGVMPVVFETTSELNLLRAERIAEEFSLNAIIRGSGYEYRRLDAVKATHRSIILPVNFPDMPAVQTPEEALQLSLAELRHWDEAPENPKRLQQDGVPFAFTAGLLKDPATFLAQVRLAVERGLSPDAALAALTTTPARLFGVENRLGTLAPGAIADLVVTTGDLFAENTVIREVWIDGKRLEVKPAPQLDPRGTWRLSISGMTDRDSTTLVLKGESESLQGTIRMKKEAQLASAVLADLRLSFSFQGDSVGHTGIVRMSADLGAGTMLGTGEWPDGKSFTWSAGRTAAFVATPDTAKHRHIAPALFPPVYPNGEFGRATLPELPAAVLVRGATIWTCGPEGVIADGDILFKNGKIAAVGKHLDAPADALMIDGHGKHVTPGIIDCHSHMAVEGSVNEGSEAISAEVRIGDALDCDDIDIYRDLAGGTTEAHVLHGSANPIGGQNQLIKLRWGMLPEEMKFDGAPPTIKFALGENVKQSNWGDRYTTRYPQTRMGVEQIIRDEFRAALDYEKAWKRYQEDHDTLPPRRDLALDAILEILHGKRFIHCHSYRQDEILMLMRVADD
ncbi:MAG TPA: amidohydrolase family protein, partial [Bacteroidota bacterium]|nr:amidohydrolase family protein [Bacteroidota bacterium]